MAENFAQLFADSEKESSFDQGVIRKAEVVDIISDFVILYASGSKSESYVPIAEFKNEQGELEVKVGDQVDVYLESFENGSGKTIFSREKAKLMAVWARLEEAFKNGELVKGKILNRVRGGFIVELDKVKAFLPGSLADSKLIKDFPALEQQELEFKIIKVDRATNNIVVSRRAALMMISSPERDELLAKINEGMELTGVVKNLTDYGAFIDLGGLDGLLHITDISWRRIRHPSDVLSVGQEIHVKVLKYDKENCRVSLGMKQLVEDPWQHIEERYPVGSKITGHVTNVMDYGCFVEIAEGIEGLVHMSELSWINHNLHPSKIVTPGQEVEVLVLDIEPQRRRISLGLKQCTPNPWKEFAATHSRGEVLKGVVNSIADFGLFVSLENGIDGLVHLSDLSWKEPGDKVIKNYHKNQEIEVQILGIDIDRERISLGIKQINSNNTNASDDGDSNSNGDAESSNAHENEDNAPYLNLPKGSLVSGTVTQVDAKAALVDLGNGVIGRVKASEVSKERINDVTEWLQVGDVIEAKVLGVDRKAEVVNISIREMQAQAVHSGEAPTNNSLGAMLKEQLVRNNDQNTDQVECAPESPAALQAESQSAAESVAE